MIKKKKPPLAADILRQLPPTRKETGKVIRDGLIRDPTITWTPTAENVIIDGAAQNMSVRSIIKWLAQDKQ